MPEGGYFWFASYPHGRRRANAQSFGVVAGRTERYHDSRGNLMLSDDQWFKTRLQHHAVELDGARPAKSMLNAAVCGLVHLEAGDCCKTWRPGALKRD